MSDPTNEPFWAGVWRVFGRRFPLLLVTVTAISMIFGTALSFGMPRVYVKWGILFSTVIIVGWLELLEWMEEDERKRR